MMNCINLKKIMHKLNNTLTKLLMIFIVTFLFSYNVKAIDYIEKESESIIKWAISDNLETGYYKLKVNDITYQVHLYVYNGNQEWNSDMTFGDENDIATSSTDAVNMVMVIVNGNLTVGENATVGPYYTIYGGPKGFSLIVNGTLINNGNINNNHGAKATGENVYLWKNTDDTYEYVPAVGATGGAKVSITSGSGTVKNGNAGSDGTNRSTGGGGTGSGRRWSYNAYIGAGGSGTSYSGGAGSGAANSDGGGGSTATSAAGSSVGGAGSKGIVRSSNSSGYQQISLGGVGNPSGGYESYRASIRNYVQTHGTGGLLILYSANLTNNGTITADGTQAGTASRASGSGRVDPGGSSGGGSVNIFYGIIESEGTITANGGAKRCITSCNGAGGNGTVTKTQLVLEEEFLNPTLSSLEVDKGTITPAFTSNNHDYYVTLDSESSNVNISAELTNNENTITYGVGNFNIPSGTSEHTIVITSKIGIISTYTIHFYREPSSYKYLNGIKIDDSEIENFDPEKLQYNISVPYSSDEINIEAIVGRSSQTIYGDGTIKLNSGDNVVPITVVSEDSKNTVIYTLNIYREHSSKLKDLKIDGYEIDPVFDKETYTYSVTVVSNTMSLKVNTTPFDEEATVTLNGLGYIKNSGKATITVTEPNSESTTYTINIIKEGKPAQTDFEYGYTGEYQTFTAPATGYYKIELWGAQGGNSVGNSSKACSYGRGNAYAAGGCGGFGAYTSGTIYLSKDTTLYIYVGGRGTNGKAGRNVAGGWNGGGSSTYDHSDNEASGSGGGSTDIRLVATSTSTTWNEFESLKSRIMVAAGGGGGSDVYPGGNGGTLTSTKNRYSNGATQKTGYGFGYGENAVYRVSNKDVAGGGSGYFGGYSTAASSSNYSNFGQTGTGGSSFVSGCSGCEAISESSSSSNIIFLNSNEHYSGYIFSDIQMIEGGKSQPAKTTGYTVGNVSNGYAKITMLPQPSENNFLSSITVKVNDEVRTYTPEFNLETEDYYLSVDSTETKITINARPEDSKATIEGIGEQNVEAGENIYEIKVTAESGSIKTYRVHVTRESNSNGYPNDITISGMVPSLCSIDEAYCKLNPATFDKNTNSYYVTVPSRIKQLYFSVEKGHDYQTVKGEGKVTLNGGENIFTIEITSEDTKETSVYTYYITRDMAGNTDLSKLEIVDPERTINYDPDITEYYLSVPNDYDKIKEMIVETDDELASVVIVGNENFVVGMNHVNIIVTAQNGEVKIYTLNVYREKNDNVYLQNIEVKNDNTTYELIPEFNKINVGDYKVTVPNDVTSITLNAKAEANTTIVSGTGIKELHTGENKFELITTSEKGLTEVYTIIITRLKNSNTDLNSITISDDEKQYELNPTFNKDVLEYNVIVDEGVTKIDIEATPLVTTTKYKLLDNNTIKIGNNVKRIMTIAEDGTSKIYVLNITRNPSSNNYLSNLIVKDENTYVLTPKFSKEITEYELEVENSVKKLSITGIKEDSLSLVKGSGNYSLKVGENEIRIDVTSEDKNTRTYTLKITRKANSDATLSSITTSEGILVPEFNKDNLNYSVNVENDIETIDIKGIPTVNTTSVTGNGTYKLVSGNNIIELVTEAEDGTTKTYKIDVYKDKSDNDNINYLLMEEGIITPTFNSNIISYTALVPNNVTKGTFHVELEDKFATYEIINNNFENSETEVIIRVISESGKIKDYKINVIRQEKEVASNYLTNIEIDNGILTPTFDKEQLYYEVTVPYETTKVNINATLEDKSATLTGVGAYNLNVGKNLIPLEVVGTDGKKRSYQVVVIRKENTEARLSNLMINSATLTPNFDKDIYEYNLTTTENSLSFNKIETIDSNATYEIINNSFAENKKYDVIIKVTAQDKLTTKEYILHVEKLPSNNNNLSNLTVDGYTLTPVFSKSTTLYTLTVGNDVNSVLVEATKEHNLATVTGDGSQDLDVGENEIVIEVTSESGKTKAYTIVITREKSDNNNLSNIIVNNGTMETFDPAKTNYNVEVNYEETNLDLTVITEDDGATYKINNNNLAVGNNIVEIEVTAENGNVKTYTLNVVRNKIISSLLKDLQIENYEISPIFNSYINNYSVLIDNEVTSLNIAATPLDSDANVKIIGNENFIVGINNVTIKVTSRDNSSTEIYYLQVERQSSSNTYLDYLYTSEGDLTPLFNKNTLTYNIEVENNVEEIELFGEAVDKSTTVTGLGIYSLNLGVNKIPVKVTTKTGISRTYYVIVNRKKNSDNYLESLTVKVGNTNYDLTPTFDKNTLTYTVTVPIGTKTVDVDGKIASNAKVEGFGTKNIVAGENEININVTSEDGQIRTYKIIIEREKSDNNYLIDLKPSIGSLEPLFDYTNTDYTLNLDSSASTLSFEAITEDEGAVVSGVESKIVPDGTSTRNILVTSEDGITRTYTITINKDRSDNAKLASLSINGYSLKEEFNSDIYEYHVTVPNSKKILLPSDVVATLQDQNAKITKQANTNLYTNEENVYIIKVTAKDGFTISEYKIIIEREKSNNADLSNLKVNTGYLLENFNPNVYEYTWLVKKNSIINTDSVIAVSSDSNATIIKTESLAVKEDNEYIVKVISEDESKTIEYKLKLQLDLSNDSTLSYINVDPGYYLPNFSSNIYEYDVYEYEDTESITIDSKPNSENATVTSGNGILNLNEEKIVHNIVVTSEDGTTSTYTLNIHRTIKKDKYLKNITLNNLDTLDCNDKCTLNPTFVSDVKEYSIKVPYEYTILSINSEKMNDEQTVKYKVGENYIDEYDLPLGITKVIVEVYDGMNEKTMEYTLNIERCKSSNAYLKDLNIDNYSLNVEFNKNILEYNIEVTNDINEIKVNALPELSDSTIEINGYNYLQEGNNDVEIIVTAPDGTYKTYIVHVFKNPKYNSYLKNITVSTGIFWNLSPKFNKTTYEYTTTVSGIYNKVTIEAVPDDSNTIVTGTGEYDIKTGMNEIILVATAKDGSQSTYKINILKGSERNVNLKSLNVVESPIDNFDKGTTKYELNVSEDVNKLTINAIPEDSSSSVIIVGNENLVSGVNYVNIIVMSSDRTASKTYQLKVNKEKSSNNYLKELQVINENNEIISLNPEFDKDTNSYNIEVDASQEKVIINAIPENIMSTVTGTGEESLAFGLNTKVITVTSENGTINTYRINIYKNYNLNLKNIISDIGEITPSFNKDILEYNIKLPNNETEITFIAQKESDKVKVLGNGTYNLSTGNNEIIFTVTAPDNKSKQYKVIVEREKSDNNNISSLIVKQGKLDKAFDKDTTTYEVNVRKNVTSLDMDIELEDKSATYEIVDNNFTDIGTYPVTIKVTAENGNVKNYIINVNVQQDAYFSNRLLSLTLSNGSLTPDFDPDINYYAVTVPNSINNVEINAVKENVDAKVEGLGVHNLDIGRNLIQINVTSKDGIINTYTLVIYRSGNSDATLSSLNIKNQKYYPIFNKNEENYELEVSSDINNLEIDAIPTDPNSNVNISGNKNLITGENIIKIVVTAPDNITSKTYTIKVNKKVSQNNYLSSLTVQGYDITPSFDKTNQGPYIVNVNSSVNNVIIDATGEDEKTTITGIGNISLKSGQNIINVVATSEDKKERIYTIIINKSQNSDSTLKDIVINNGTLTPTFNSNILEYTINIDKDINNVNVIGIPTISSSIVTGNGNYDLDNEITEVSLVVVSEDSNKTTYKLKFIKEVDKSSKIKNLTIKDGKLTPTFESITTNYNINVPYEVTSLDMEVLLEDIDATYKVEGNSNFKVGNNLVKITVTSSDLNSETIYYINVNRQSLSSNYLKSLDIGYTLNPLFEKTNLYYTVDVNSSVDSINIKALAEDISSTVTGTGIYNLEYGENTFYIDVESTNGNIRTYTIKVNRKQEYDNYLLSLIPSSGTLNPAFDKLTNEYTLDLDETITELTLTGTVSENSSVVGLGTFDVKGGISDRTITVISESGDKNIYKININRKLSSNTELIDLIPSSGSLEYSNDIYDYKIEVDDNISVISFEAILKNEFAKVTGNELHNLNYGDNNIVIAVVAEDGTTRTINVKVTRNKEINSIIVSENSIILKENESKLITYTLNPTDTSYKDVEWISNNTDIATVIDGNITGLKEGYTTIEVRSTHNNNIKTTINVSVIKTEITSSVYDIYRDTDIKYTIGSEPKTKLSDYVVNFDNNQSTLYVYDDEGNRITDLDKYVGTNMKIKLEINNTTYDELVIAVRGDLDGDGLVTVSDITYIKNIILKKLEREFILEKVSDLDNDELTTVGDMTIVKNYILKKVNILN